MPAIINSRLNECRFAWLRHFKTGLWHWHTVLTCLLLCTAGSNSKDGSLRKRRVGAGDVEMTDVSDQSEAVLS